MCTSLHLLLYILNLSDDEEKKKKRKKNRKYLVGKGGCEYVTEICYGYGTSGRSVKICYRY